MVLLGVRGGQHLLEYPAHLRRVRPQHVVEPLAVELGGGRTQQLLAGRTGVADHARTVANGDHVTGASHQLGQAFIEAPRRHPRDAD